MYREFSLGGPKAPCKGCTKRVLGCHSVCKDYHDFLKENEEIKEIRHDESIAYADIQFSFKKIASETVWRKRT